MTKRYSHYFKFLSQHVITPFYEVRLQRLNHLKLKTILKKKNPYLFKAKNVETAGEFVKSILDAYLSSQEETMFGNYLEAFAIHVSADLDGGRKSTEFKSVDLEFERDNVYYIVSIKSGPVWGNKDQIDRMKDNFKAAKAALRKRSAITDEIVAVNGCIYGKDKKPFKDNTDPDKAYYKYCGQEFWEFISDNDQFYREIIKPIDKEAKRRDEIFKAAYSSKVNEMTRDFINEFITNNQIDWIKLIDFVSKKES